MAAPATAVEDLPTAPGRIPGLGHAPALIRSRLRFLGSLPRIGPVVRVDLPGRYCCAVTEPDLVREIAADGASFGRARSLAEEERAAGNRATAVRARNGYRAGWPATGASEHLAALRTECERIARIWAESTGLDAAREMNALVLATMDRTLLAGRLRSSDVAQIHRLLPEIRRGAVLRTLLPAGIAGFPPVQRRLARARVELQSIVDAILARDAESGGADPVAALGRGRARSGSSDLHRDVLDTALAATSGTAAVLAWALHELAQHPDLQGRLHRELDEVLAGGPVTPDALDALVRTRRIVTEVLRLYAVPLVARRCLRDVQIGGIAFPETSELLCSPHALHRDPEHHLRPHLFDPDRWMSGAAPGTGTFLPFGLGGAGSADEELVHRECAVALATLLAHLRVVPVHRHRVRATIGGSVAPDAIPLGVLRR